MSLKKSHIQYKMILPRNCDHSITHLFTKLRFWCSQPFINLFSKRLLLKPYHSIKMPSFNYLTTQPHSLKTTWSEVYVINSGSFHSRRIFSSTKSYHVLPILSFLGFLKLFCLFGVQHLCYSDEQKHVALFSITDTIFI